jgi:RHS repeat-associated protein
MPTLLAALRDLLPSVRLRTVALGAVFAFSTFAVQAAPSGLPVDRPAELQPQPVQALGCASEPTFTGYITNTYTTTAATLSTTGLVRGYISDVLTTWSCTAAYRYDGLAWQRETPTGGANYQWGTLINSTSVPCNWVVNETSYLKANGGSSCHTSDSDNGMQLVLAATGADPLMERIWRADNSPDEPGDFMFVHSDCTSYYEDAATPGQKMRWATTFATTDTTNRPGANCDPSVIDGTGTTQSIVVDGTPPDLAFDWPVTGIGPVVVPSAFASVRFDATDNVAGFATGANDWDLQRQKAAWNGSTCGTFGNDGSATSGVTDALDQVVTQSLDANACYQWTLAASDKNGNAAATITSGSIRVDPGATLGLPSFGSVESWDLGAGDSLAVNVGTGNAVLSHPIVSLPIQGSSVGLSLTYNRQDTTNVGMGTGWRLDAFRRLSIATNGDVTFTDGQGARHVFVWNVLTSSYTRPSTLYATLTKDTGPNPDEYTLTYRDLSKDIFSELVTGTAYLKREQDRHNNGVNFGYTSTNLTSITDTVASRSIALAWTSGTLTSITDWATIDGSGIVQASGTPNRTHRFFYSGGQLIGWADPLNTGSSCTSGVPSGASHVTCIAYPTNGLEISKTQTVTVLSGSSLSTLTRTGSSGDTALKTIVAFAGSDVTSVKDAQEAKDGTSGTLFSHPGAWQTRVIRDGAGSATTSLDTTTTSTHLPPTLGAGPDSLARIGTERRALASDPNGAIDRVTTYSTTYPIEPASIVEDAGSGRLNRTTTYEYVASSLGLLLRIKEPLAGASQRWTEYVYNPNNDVSLVTVSLDGGSTKTVTRTCYTTQSNTCLTSETGLSPVRVIENWVSGGAVDDDTNVATDYTYDAQGRMTFETRHVRSSSGGVVDDRVTGYVHASNGTLTTMIANYSDGDTADTSDSTPSSPDWARTDLTTAYTYDSAGNQASVADARRPLTTSPGTDDYMTRTTYDALGQAITTRQPTTKDGATCSPDPACRTATTTYDELGGARLAIDSDGTQAGTETDRAGRTVKTHEDPDGAGGTAARQTSLMTLDPQGRTLTSKDDRQLDSPNVDQATYAFDELGRAVSVIVADVVGSVGPDEATTITTYDALDRVTCVQDGWSSGACATATSAGLSTITTYDLGGRVTAVDDEFTCTTTTSDYRDLTTQVIEGRSAGTCTGAGTRTITQTYDGLGRLATRTTGGLTLENNTYDSAGRLVKSWADEGAADRVTETWYTKLDQPLETRRHLDTSGTLSERTWSRSTADAAGNETDRCTWAASPTEWCHKADDATWASPVPITRSSSIYDARNQRIGLFVPGEGETTYDPTADYQVQGVFLPLGTGTRERQTIHGYDSRDRLVTITVYVCTAKERPFCTGAEIASSSVTDTYEYDDAGNRTKVVEDNGSGALTRYYCYDARNQLTSVSTSSATCASGVVETYAYDDAGNRTAAGSRTFTYTAAGQLGSCSSTACGTPTFDADGRLTAITTASGAWTYQYDAEGRLTTACKASSCTGTPARLDMTYDAQGHRIRLVETPAAGGSPVVTTDFSYEGERVVREVSTSSAGPIVTRTFTTDEAGAILKMTVVTTGGGSTADDGTYLVTYNGHGDAISLAEIDPTTGVLTTANRVTYSTWGTPAVTTHNGYASLGFRYLYVGRFDVQWDDFASAGLLYMHARHYHPEFGRFLQPDPSAQETNLYAYAGNSPITKIDPSGLRGGFGTVIYERVRTVSWLEVTIYSLGPGILCAGGTARVSHPLIAIAVSLACGLAGNFIAPEEGDRQIYRVYRSGSHLTVTNRNYERLSNGSYVFDYAVPARRYRYSVVCLSVLKGSPIKGGLIHCKL